MPITTLNHSINFLVDRVVLKVRFDLRARQNFNYRKSNLWLNSRIITKVCPMMIRRASAVTEGLSGPGS